MSTKDDAQAYAPLIDRSDCCDDWPKPCTYHEGQEDLLGTLEALPVEQRMAAMGMKPVEVANDAGEPWRTCWIEGDRGFVYDPDEVLDGDAITAAAAHRDVTNTEGDQG